VEDAYKHALFTSTSLKSPVRFEAVEMKDPYLPEKAAIEKIRRETVDTKTYTVRLLDERKRAEFSVEPGQFIMVSLFGIGEAPFSLSSSPNSDRAFNTTVRAVGNVTSALDRFEEGTIIGVRGPYGHGWPVESAQGKDVLIIAGGIGLPPLRPVITKIAQERRHYGRLEILYGARTPDQMIFPYEYEDWEKIEDTRLELTVDSVPPGTVWQYNVGVVTTLFNEMKTSTENSLVMTCGPEIMMRFVVRGLLAKRFTPDQIYVSLERRMKCGIAQCGHCQIGPKYVCRDGPVFRLSDIQGLPDLAL
jgi:NAD(P)H-flavin reductase